MREYARCASLLCVCTQTELEIFTLHRNIQIDVASLSILFISDSCSFSKFEFMNKLGVHTFRRDGGSLHPRRRRRQRKMVNAILT